MDKNKDNDKNIEENNLYFADKQNLFKCLYVLTLLFSLIQSFMVQGWTRMVLTFLLTILFISSILFMSQRFNKRWILYPLFGLLLLSFVTTAFVLIIKFNVISLLCLFSELPILILLFLLFRNFYLKKDNSYFMNLKFINLFIFVISFVYLFIFGIMIYFNLLTESISSAFITLINPYTYLIVLIKEFSVIINWAILFTAILGYVSFSYFEKEE